MQALEKQIDLREVEIRRNKAFNHALAVLNLRLVDGKLKPNHEFHRSTLMYKQHLLNKALRGTGEDDINFIIGDAGSCRNSNYYMDMTVSTIMRLQKTEPVVDRYMNMGHTPAKLVEMRSKFQHRLMKASQHVFTMSHWLHDQLVEDGLPDGQIVYAGGDINVDYTLHDPSKRKGNKILFVGRDFERKGGKLTVDAFRILKNRKPDAELWIVGSTPEIDIAGVNVIGNVPRDRIFEYYNKCDVLCLPSYYEAFGISFPEALSFGLPCIGRNSFEMRHFIQNGYNGYLLHPIEDNPDELAEKMEDLLTNTKIRHCATQQRLTIVEEYSWDAVAGRIVKALTKE